MLDNHSEDSDAADAAIEEYLRLVDAGETVDRTAFIAAHPDVAKELRSFFGSLSLLQKMAGPGGLNESNHARSIGQPLHGLAGSSDSRLPWTSLPAMFGRYRVESLLGRGAMGAVYRAHDTQLDRPVALKLSNFAEDTALELKERMLQEARTAASLSHLNICRVYDVGEIDGTRFIAMELIEGRSLADYIHAGHLLPPQTVVLIIRKLALALQAAHDIGIVHRDLKPSNVIINAAREPILMDFGLAHRLVVTGEERLTKAGMLIGSPAYMSPEQVRADGTGIGPASDIYGLGVVLYELLTGQLPFSGSVMTILAKVLSEEPPSIQTVRPEIDKNLSDICRKMLAKRPEDRFSSMNEVAEALQHWLHSAAHSNHEMVLPAEESANPVVPPSSTPAGINDSAFDGKKLRTTTKTRLLEIAQTANVALGNHRLFWLIPLGVLLLVIGIGVVTRLTRTWNNREQIRDPYANGTNASRTPPGTSPKSDAVVTLAVMDFDNHSGDPSLDGFRLGFRDMLVTDLSHIAEIRVLERSRLEVLLKEHDLTSTPFINPQFAVKLGCGLSARVMLSGSFVISGDAIRVDVRMIDVETSAVLSAEAVQGTKSDLFGLQTALTQNVVKGLKINLTDTERERLLVPQTRAFDAFRLYSDARLAQIKGRREEAEQRYRESLSSDPEFSLAFHELGRLESEALIRFSEEQLLREANAGEIGKRLQEHRHSYQQIVEADQISPDYFAGLVILSAHAGLSGDHDRERQLLVFYWHRFVERVTHKQALPFADRIKETVDREGKFFQENIDSGDYYFQVIGSTITNQNLKHELRRSLSWPRWSAIWPFDESLRGAFNVSNHKGAAERNWFETRLPRYPHEYLNNLLNSRNFVRQGTNRIPQRRERDKNEVRRLNPPLLRAPEAPVPRGVETSTDKSQYTECLRLNMSVLRYYSRIVDKPQPLLEKIKEIERLFIADLETVHLEESGKEFLADAVKVLELLGQTAVRSEDRDAANQLIGRFVQRLKIDKGRPLPNDQ